LNASFTSLNTGSGRCRSFSAQITGTFFQSGGPISALSVTLTPYVGECKLIAPSDENDSSCTFVDYPTWCMGNPFSDTVTVEMIIAP
jgi:hypothetical protein